MSGRRYLLDTNVVIGFLAGAEWATDFISKIGEDDGDILISAVTRMELLGFPGITDDEAAMIEQFLEYVSVLGIVPEIENEAIRLRRTTRLKLPDAIICATAIRSDAALVSVDSDFEGVAQFQYINPKIILTQDN